MAKRRATRKRGRSAAIEGDAGVFKIRADSRIQSTLLLISGSFLRESLTRP
jgi:hypothetical protein